MTDYEHSRTATAFFESLYGPLAVRCHFTPNQVRDLTLSEATAIVNTLNEVK